MRRSLADGSGLLTIDHRDSPGVTPADLAALPGAIAVAGGALLERDVQQCSHCQRGIVLHPNRVRPRGYCPKCDHYVCDGCEAIRVQTGNCVPFRARLEQAAEVAEQYAGQPDHPEARSIVLTD